MMRRGTALLLGILVISVLVTFLVQLPHLFDYYRVEKDVQNFCWMARYEDPELFPVDYLRGEDTTLELTIMGCHALLFPQSLGYGRLFWLGSFIIDFVWMAKLLGFLLMPISVVYLFKLGEAVADEFTGAALSLLFVFIILASPRSTAITTGVQRAFALPLLIVFTYYLHEERYWPAAAMIFVSLVFYYPNFLIAGLTYVLSMVKIERPRRVYLDLAQSKLIPLLLVLVLSVGVIVLTVTVEPSRVLRREIPVSEDARYQPGGATPLLTGFAWMGRAGVFEDGGTVLNLFTLATVAGLVFARLRTAALRQTPPVFERLVLASLTLYAASLFLRVKLSSSVLYLSSRYTRSSLIWVALGLVGVNLLHLLSGVRLWLRRNYRVVIFFVASLAAALGVSFILLSVKLSDPAWLLGLRLTLGGPLVVLSIGGFLRIARSLVQGDGKDGSSLRSWIALVLLLGATAPIAQFHVKTLGERSTLSWEICRRMQ